MLSHDAVCCIQTHGLARASAYVHDGIYALQTFSPSREGCIGRRRGPECQERVRERLQGIGKVVRSGYCRLHMLLAEEVRQGRERLGWRLGPRKKGGGGASPPSHATQPRGEIDPDHMVLHNRFPTRLPICTYVSCSNRWASIFRWWAFRYSGHARAAALASCRAWAAAPALRCAAARLARQIAAGRWGK